jgi:hypothetical protein
MRDLAVAAGLFFVLEGLLYAAAPGAVRWIAREIPSMPDAQLRNFGVIAMMIGVGVVWLAKAFG